MADKVLVAKASELQEGVGLTVQAGSQTVALFKCDGQVYAVNNVCPHRGGPLAEGFVAGGRVACPWHGWAFDVKTGQHAMNPGITIPSYPVTIEGDQVFVTV